MTDWRTRAACYGTFNPDFFAPKGGNWTTSRAKAICGTCSVTRECLDFAMSAPGIFYGVWGGLTYKERAKLRRKEAA